MGTVELYDPDNRWRHRPAGEKAALAGGLLLVATIVPTPGVLGAVGGAAALAALVRARVGWRRWLAGVAAPVGFLLVGTLPVALTWEPGAGVRLDASAVLAFARGLAGSACLVLFATTTSLPDLLGLMRTLRCPGFAVEIMLMTYRFVSVLAGTTIAVRRTQRLRLGGGDFRSLGLLGANLLPRALDLAERHARGLEVRGYDGELRVLASARRS